MAAEVSRQIKSEAKSGLITRDFLGGCFGIESKELDLDLHVPNGWEKRLDLKSGKVYIQRSNSANSASEQKNYSQQISQKPNDSHVIAESSPSSNPNPILAGLVEQSSLDLKLVPNNNNNAASSVYTSVCTLDKVKSALDRAERASPTSSSSSSSKKRWMINVGRSQSPSNSSSLSVGEDERESSRLSNAVSSDNQAEGLLVAAACPTCLLYVLISNNDPKCPKCFSGVQLPVLCKKPKIDLNL